MKPAETEAVNELERHRSLLTVAMRSLTSEPTTDPAIFAECAFDAFARELVAMWDATRAESFSEEALGEAIYRMHMRMQLASHIVRALRTPAGVTP